MGRIRNKVKDIFSRARSSSKAPGSPLTQQSPALTASAVEPSPSPLTRVSSSNSLPHTAVTTLSSATAPPACVVHTGPHVVSSNSHSTSQHFDPKSSSSTSGTAGAGNTTSQTPNAPTSSWNNLVVTPIASLNALAGHEIFQEQLSKCQSALTEAQRRAFLGASATSILDMIAELDNQHSQNSITRKYATKVKDFLQVADNYLNALGIIIQHSPEFSSLVVGGLRFFIDIGKRYTDFFDKLEEAMEKWMHYLGYVSKYAELYSHYDEVKKAICVAYGDLIEFLKYIYELFMSETGALNSKISGTLLLRQFTQPLETNIAAFMANLNEHITFVEKITDILEKKRQWLKEKQEAEEKESRRRGEILAWLSKLEPEKDLERIYMKRHNGTGMWFLNSSEVNEWFQQDKKSLLWCYGTAGVGKTVLASTLLKDIISKHQGNPSIGICFFFFNFQAADIQKPIQLFAVLLKQLCRSQKEIPQGLQALYTKCHSNDISPTLLELQQQFEAVSSFFDEVFLVIDAFDECHQDDRKEILNGITRLFQNCSAKLKLCVTSRPEKDIKHAFTSSGFSTIKIEAMKVDQDISNFVQHQLQVRTHEYCTLNDEIRNEIEHALVSKANGMFLWAKCQVDEMFEQPSIADIRIALQSLPSDIDETYQRIVGKILKQTSAMRALAAWALMWVITARRPLSLVEFAQLVATNPDKLVPLDEVRTKYLPQTVVHSCCGFIEVEENIVRPIHYTVQEFLVTEWPWPNGWDPINAHVQITQSCLQYLSELNGFGVYRRFNKRRIRDRIPDVLNFTGELFDYVATSLPYHVKSCPATLPSTLKSLLRDTFSERESQELLRSTLYGWYIDHQDSKVPIVPAFRYFAVLDMLPVYKQVFSDHILEGLNKSVSLADAASSGSIQLVKGLLDLVADVNLRDVDGHHALYGAIKGKKPEMVKYLLDEGARINAISKNLTPIAQCTWNGLVEIAQLLIDRGANLTVQESRAVTVRKPFTTSPLHLAATYGHEAILKLLLDQQLDINMHQGHYGSVLQAAIEGGQEIIVKYLIELGAEVNTQGGEYGFALQAAAEHMNTAIMKCLLNAGADVNLVGGRYWTALQASARSREESESKVKLLLDAGAEVNAVGGEYGTALQAAAACIGRKSIVRLLLDAGAGVNIVGGKYGTALQASVGALDKSIVTLLLDAGADVNIVAGEFGTALQSAIAYGSKTYIIKLLLDAGADVNIVGGKYGSALQAAAIRRDRNHELKMLLDAGADVNLVAGEFGTALTAAAFVRNESVVKMLLDAGADVNVVGEEYGTALQAAALREDRSIVKLLLDAGADVNVVGGEYGTALQAAALRGDRSIVKLLLDAGADVNIVCGKYGTALHAAIAEKEESSVKMLLDAGADVNFVTGEYGTALQAASWKGDGSVVKLLLDAGAEVNTVSGKYGTALLAAAVSKEGESVVKLLLDAGAEVNIVSGEYGTALHATIAAQKEESVVKMLLDAGADVNFVTGEYGTALQAAAWVGDESIVKLLLDAGAEVNILGGKYGTALVAAAWNSYASIVKLLLDAGAEVNIFHRRYGTALYAAAFRDDVVKMLLDAGAEVNTVSGEYGTALQVAALSGRESLVRLLLDAGVNVNTVSGKYGTALQAAALRGDRSIVKLLLDAGAEVNILGRKYGTALIAAAWKGYRSIVKLLLDAGAEVNIASRRYGTPLHAAAYHGGEYMVKMLLNAGADVNIISGTHGTALQAAAWIEDRSVVKLLLDAGAEVNTVSGEYGTALQAAACKGGESVVKMLLDAKADVNLVGGKFGTALHAAASSHCLQGFMILLEAGADVHTTAGQYGTVLQATACTSYFSRENVEKVKALLERGVDVNARGGENGTALNALERLYDTVMQPRKPPAVYDWGHGKVAIGRAIKMLKDHGAEAGAWRA